MRFVSTLMTAPKRPLINAREACKRLGICRSTLDRLVRQGPFPPTRPRVAGDARGAGRGGGLAVRGRWHRPGPDLSGLIRAEVAGAPALV